MATIVTLGQTLPFGFSKNANRPICLSIKSIGEENHTLQEYKNYAGCCGCQQKMQTRQTYGQKRKEKKMKIDNIEMDMMYRSAFNNEMASLHKLQGEEVSCMK